MELRAFVARALCDIINGVSDAQKDTKPGTIVPPIKRTHQAVEAGVSDLTTVEFEVTVKADERAGKEARLSVVAAVVGGGISGERGSSSGHAARLSFRVPIVYPNSQ